ncbi:MAG: glucokinase [Desulforhopalus sp.]
MSTLLVADIGGTKSELALFGDVGSIAEPLLKLRYLNADYSSFSQIVELFLSECDPSPSYGCFAVAGVVDGNNGILTNLEWEVNGPELAKRFALDKTILLNDLTAVCSAVGVLPSDDLLEIQPGIGVKGEVRGVLAPGTGLGQGLVIDYNGQTFCRGSEGGHVDFAPVNEEQTALLQWMRRKSMPVSCEMVAGGPAISNLYDFCREYHHIPESKDVVEKLSQVSDRVPVIVKNGTGDTACPLCQKTLDLFLSILGSEAGNLALKLYATGGIYLGGGILPRLVGLVSFDGFLRGFRSKGVMSPFMDNVPIYLILRKDAALLGALHYGRQHLLADSLI